MGQLLATLRKSDNKRAVELFLDFESMWWLNRKHSNQKMYCEHRPTETSNSSICANDQDDRHGGLCFIQLHDNRMSIKHEYWENSLTRPLSFFYQQLFTVYRRKCEARSIHYIIRIFEILNAINNGRDTQPGRIQIAFPPDTYFNQTATVPEGV